MKNTTIETTIFDRFAISSKRTKTDEGYLVIKDCKLAKPGILRYLGAEFKPKFTGDAAMIISIDRPAAVVLAKEVVDACNNKPITMGHPGIVDAANAKTHSVGHVLNNCRVEGNFIVGDIMITDAATVRSVEMGMDQLSLGHKSRYEFTPGITQDGDTFDARMVMTKPNHLAIVEKGRCGPECKISDGQPETHKEEKLMELQTVIFDGISYEMTPQGAQINKSLEQKVSDLEAEKTQLVQDHATATVGTKAAAQKELDTLQAKLDDATSQIVGDEALEARMQGRMELLKTVEAIVGDYDATGKSEAQIKADVVTTKCSVDVTGKSTDYIDARFDALLENGKGQNAYGIVMGDHATTVQKGSATPTGQSASAKKREERSKANRNAWKPAKETV